MTMPESGKIIDNPRPDRKAPSVPVRIRISFDSTEDIVDDSPTGPIELTLEATNADGEIAEWLDDDFWTDVINRLSQRSGTVHILPTPGAVLHPVILHQMEMLQRVMPSWRSVAHAFADDFKDDAEKRQIASSAFSELRIEDTCRSISQRSEMGSPQPQVDELFRQIRHHQNSLGNSTPVLVRLPSTKPRPAVESNRATTPREIGKQPSQF